MQEQVAQTLTPKAALLALGVRPELLSAEDRRCLDEDGFVVLEDVIDQDQLPHIRKVMDEVLAASRLKNASDAEVRERAARSVESGVSGLEYLESERAKYLEDMSVEKFDEYLATARRTHESLRRALADNDLAVMRQILTTEYGEQYGADLVTDLFESDPVFTMVLKTPRVLAAVTHVLGPMIHLNGMFLRSPRPGEGQQPLHRVEDGPRVFSNTFWMIDDVTPENGPTRVVPGSHWLSHAPGDELDGDPMRTHPREVKILGRAGSVVVTDDRVWHGGSLRRGTAPRRMVQCGFINRSMHPSIALRHPEETSAGLTPAQRWLLNPEARSFNGSATDG